MEISTIIPHIEVLIFASDKPLTSMDIVELINNTFGFLEERILLDQVETALDGIREKYNSEFYPFEVKESGGGWQFLTKIDFHTTIAQLNGDKFLKRLSNAALETLAIIAYKQPITKGEIEAIRGVNSDYSIQKLLEKELILISGRNEHSPGKPLLYATSKSFMDYFGINNAEDLPKIREILTEQLMEGTIIRPEDFTNQPIADNIGFNTSSEDFIDEDNVNDIDTSTSAEPIMAAENEPTAHSEIDSDAEESSDSDNHEAASENKEPTE
ncbi:MAG: SMC-Scp complex subunit ScpB [Bacteroidetes bacterium]|nr:SMC-Scp complex subunit ScpB [Bacteroidota bacterium]